jgi:hypothetical protein
VLNSVHNSRREQDRVRAAGGLITNISLTGSGPSDDPRAGLGPLRIWPGGVANARSIGDFDVPGLLLPCPHITQVRVPREGGRIVLASDGVWDSVDLHRCAKVARPYAAPEAAERVVTQAVRTQGGAPRDDATVVVLDVLPAGTPSFPEALGRRLKRSVSRAAALALAEAAGGRPLEAGSAPAALRRRPGSASPSRRSGDGGGDDAPGTGSARRGGGLLGCCMSAPATGGDDDGVLAVALEEAVRKVDGDRTVRGGGYGPSVRGGSAFLGAVAGSRRPSSEAAAAGFVAGASPPPAAEGSAHSTGSAGTALRAAGSAGVEVGGFSSRPRAHVLHTVDVAVLLGHLPPAPCGASASGPSDAAPWLSPALRRELLHLQADAHRVHASRSGSKPAALPASKAGDGGGGRGAAAGPSPADASRRMGAGPTPVVVVPALK